MRNVSKPGTPDLVITVRTAPTTVVAVAGEIDVASAPDLAAVVHGLIDRGRRRLVVDLGETRFIDAAGLRVLLDASVRARAAGGRLALRRPSPVVRRVLDITQVDRLLAVEPQLAPLTLRRRPWRGRTLAQRDLAGNPPTPADPG